MSQHSDVVLAHYGVKGMKWGVRRNREPVEVSTSIRPGKKVKASGGKNQGASEDAIRAARYKQVAKKSTTDSLSTKELQEMVNRMNLEQQYDRLANQKQTSKGMKVAKAILTNPTYSGVAVGIAGIGLAKYGDELPGAAAAAAKFGLKVGSKLHRLAQELEPLGGGGKKKKK